jgi:hypothetical protein
MRAFTLFALLGSAGIIACGGSDATTAPVTVDVSGTYTLRTVNGAALPFALGVDASGAADALVDDAFTLTTNGSYIENGHESVTPTGGVATTQTVSDVGTYTFSNGVATLVSSEGIGTATATISGSTFTLVATGIVAVYTK